MQMQAICAVETPIHERLKAISAALAAEPNDGRAAPVSEARAVGDYFDRHFHTLAGQRKTIQNSTTSVAMFMYILAERMHLLAHETSWRDDAHLVCADIAPALTQMDATEPILFMSTSQIVRCVSTLQKTWYDRALGGGTGAVPAQTRALLRHLQNRVALLLTYPFDDVTFDMAKYRSRSTKGGGGQLGNYVANLAFAYDMCSILGSMRHDMYKYATFKCVGRAPTQPETAAWAWLATMMGRVQGDALSIAFQTMHTEKSVQIGDKLIFLRRRPMAEGATSMDIIAETHGVEYSKKVHAEADVRLVDVYKDPQYADTVWLCVTGYYFRQKTGIPWLSTCVGARFSATGSLSAGPQSPYPRIIFMPILNTYGIASGNLSRFSVCGSALQAILTWMLMMRDTHKGMYEHKSSNIDLTQIIDEYISALGP